MARLRSLQSPKYVEASDEKSTDLKVCYAADKKSRFSKYVVAAVKKPTESKVC